MTERRPELAPPVVPQPAWSLSQPVASRPPGAATGAAEALLARLGAGAHAPPPSRSLLAQLDDLPASVRAPEAAPMLAAFADRDAPLADVLRDIGAPPPPPAARPAPGADLLRALRLNGRD
ncbi:hypothetical protein ACFOD4_16720 [Pseudoroseomonas globiformis]|uniref:Uncharacterized protein n=1 Tax=Teichococcus globiformis TaxID=2307229 RepID=A0ABV7G1Z8_9PROT